MNAALCELLGSEPHALVGRSVLRLVRRIADPGAWGGQWEIDLAAAGDVCRVTISEDGWVANPVLRLISKYLIGHTRTIDIYLADLARSFGVQEPRPRDA